MGCQRSELAVRSVDRYGPTETQVRYERGDQAVARLVVAGPIVPMGEQPGRGHWAVSVRIGTGSGDLHDIDVPAVDEIVYWRVAIARGRSPGHQPGLRGSISGQALAHS
jgi:hypothetical protein